MFNQTKELAEARTVTMYPDQWAAVDAYAKDMGYGSTSAGLRRIVVEWLQAQLERTAQVPTSVES